MTETEQRAAVVAEALSWLGTPYHHRGRIKGVGVDCAMLPAEVYEAAGIIPHQEVAYYPRDWHLHRSGERYLEIVTRYAHEITADQIGPGDLVLWRIGRPFAHGAIVVNWPECIHAAVRGPVHVVNIEQDADLAAREKRFFSVCGGV